MFSVVMSNFIDALGIKAIETGMILSIVGDIKPFMCSKKKAPDQTVREMCSYNERWDFPTASFAQIFTADVLKVFRTILYIL